jgi:hypothetical protein
MTVLAANPLGGNLILAAYLFVAMVGFVFGFFTITGSGINSHPIDGRDAAPGSKLPDEFTQFAARQVHDRDMRDVETERRVDERLGLIPVDVTRPEPALDLSLDEVNRALAAEAAERKGEKPANEERPPVR